MRKFCFLLAVLPFIGCSNDDNAPADEGAILTGDIYGKWYYDDMVINGQSIPYNDHEACGKDYIEFYDVNKMRAIDVWDCVEDIDSEGTFIKNNNNLTLITEDGSNTVEILELSDFKLSFTYKYDGDEDGAEETYIQNLDREENLN